MNIEIHNPELAQRLAGHLQAGHFQDTAELIAKALDALEERTTVTATPAATTETGAVILAALQSSPYPEIDLTPPRLPVTKVRDVVF